MSGPQEKVAFGEATPRDTSGLLKIPQESAKVVNAPNTGSMFAQTSTSGSKEGQNSPAFIETRATRTSLEISTTPFQIPNVSRQDTLDNKTLSSHSTFEKKSTVITLVDSVNASDAALPLPKATAVARDDVAANQTTPTVSQGLWRHWMLELSFLVISIACFIAIVAVLHTFDEQSLPNMPLNITLNTFVAFLATLSKAALMLPIMEAISQCKWNWFHQGKRPLSDFEMFDRASRGVWGSFSLVGVIRWRHFATLGAIVTIVGMVTSPIIQQCVTYPTRFIPEPTDVAQTTVSTYVGAINDVKDIQKFFELESIVLSGITGANAGGTDAAIMAPTCPTGQCNFPTVKTLSICSKTADISSHISVSRVSDSTPDDWSLVWQMNTGPNSSGDWNGTDAWNLSLPIEGYWMVSPTPYFVYGLALNKSLAFAGDDDLYQRTLYDAVLLYLDGPNMKIPSHDKYPLPPAHAVEAVFYACAQELNISVVNGTASQTATELPHSIIKAETTPAFVFDCTSDISSNASIAQCGMSTRAYNWTNTWLVLAEPSVDPATSNFTINYQVLELFGDAFWSALFGGWAWDEAGYTYSTLAGGVNTIPMALFGPESQNRDAGATLDKLSDTMKQMATAATNTIRSLPAYVANTYAINGTAWTTEPYVHVRWGWLAFLAVQIITGATFLLLTIFTTGRRRGSVFKSSALATMLALGIDSRQIAGPASTLTDMRTRAVELQGRLVDKELIIEKGKETV